MSAFAGPTPAVVHGTSINTPTTPRFYGVHIGTVEDNQDPAQQGRVKVRLPWLTDGSDAYTVWARLATSMAGDARGTWFVPDVGDEVLVAFGAGHPEQPYVVGALWNGKDAAPVSMDADNNVKAIVSRSDIRISLDDTQGAVTLSLSTPGGQKVTLSDSGNTVRVEDVTGNSVELAPAGITVTAASKLTLKATTIDVSCSMMKVDSPLSNFSGVVKSDTNITNTTVSASYTPGAGNVW